MRRKGKIGKREGNKEKNEGNKKGKKERRNKIFPQSYIDDCLKYTVRANLTGCYPKFRAE